MSVLACYRTRQRIGAYLDGALDAAGARSARAHLGSCERCRLEADEVRRLRSLVAAALGPVGEPDWTGFWPGILRAIEDRARVAPLPARSAWRRGRWAVMTGALAAALLLPLIVWRAPESQPSREAPVIVRSADTESPGSTVMVYSRPDQELAVVWVFDAD
ncbi:MAG: zf-HC2 domain-containing protein [Candidatus Rokubacteria bacterium]|nr:zf-HC2 domain-containing protein [Candidatus Rokubacteria bacterium]